MGKKKAQEKSPGKKQRFLEGEADVLKEKVSTPGTRTLKKTWWRGEKRFPRKAQ